MARPTDLAAPTGTRCVECGSLLVERVLPDAVITVGEVRVAMRRHTDFVVCRKCMSMYRVIDLQEGHPVRLTDEDLLHLSDPLETGHS